MKTKNRRLVSFLVLGAIVIGTIYFLGRKDTSRTQHVGEQPARIDLQSPDSLSASYQVASNSPSPEPMHIQAKLGLFAQGAKARLRNEITDHELLILEKLYNKMVSKREQMELASAKREEVNPKTVLVTIPAYFEEGGLALYTDFLTSLSNELGQQRGEELADKLGPSIQANNAHFGEEEQVMLIEDNGPSIHIVHGSGALLKIDDGFQLTHISRNSDLLPQQLSTYGYLAPLFPASFSSTKK